MIALLFAFLATVLGLLGSVPSHTVPIPLAAPTPHVTASPVVTVQPRASRSRTATTAPATTRLMEVTMYCETGNRTASGRWPARGMAAANAYSFGTRLSVPGWGVVTVEDRSAPGATDVDLFGGNDPGCETRAIQWGRRHLAVSVIR